MPELSFSRSSDDDGDQSAPEFIPTTRPLIDRLPREVFTYMCTFLSIDDKRAKLPSISRSMNALIARPECYAADTLYFRFPAYSEAFDAQKWRRYSLIKIKGRLPFLPHVKSVVFKCETEGAAQSELAQRLREDILNAVGNGQIRSLCLDDYEDTVCSGLLITISLPNALTQLVFGSGGSFAGLSNLQSCSSLLDLHIKWSSSDWDVTTVPDFQRFMHSLPEQLVRLRLTMDEELYDLVDPEFKQILSSNVLLPYLQEFTCFDLDEDCINVSCIIPLGNTIMNQTKLVRPIQNACFRMDVDEIRQLRQLPLIYDLSFEVEELPVDCSRHFLTCVPSLRSLDVLTSGPVDFTPLLTQLPHSLLILSLRQYDLEDDDDPEELHHHVWNDVAVIALAKLHLLTTLEIELSSGLNSQLFDANVSDNMSLHLPSRSWPSLKSMTIEDAWLTVEQLKCILQAAPNLNSITLCNVVSSSATDVPYSDQLNYSLVVALVGRFCHKICDLTIHSPELIVSDVELEWSTDSMEEARSAFERFPMVTQSFHVIRSLTLGQFPTSATHFILSHISERAPLLQYVDLDTTSIFHLCLMRCLPHLHYFEMNEDLQKELELLPLADLFESRYQPDAIIFEDQDAAYMDFQPADDGGFYHTFRTQLDARGQSGRDAFFSMLHHLLDEGSKARLALWDSGLYLVDPCSCTSLKICPLCRRVKENAMEQLSDYDLYSQ